MSCSNCSGQPDTRAPKDSFVPVQPVPDELVHPCTTRDSGGTVTIKVPQYVLNVVNPD